jgi:endonuclease III
MAVLLLVRAYGAEFHESDRPGIDIKADVHTIRVLHRLGVSSAPTEKATVEAARRLNPDFPGAIDGALWVIGSRWCRPTRPLCGDCVVGDACPEGRKRG